MLAIVLSSAIICKQVCLLHCFIFVTFVYNYNCKTMLKTKHYDLGLFHFHNNIQIKSELSCLLSYRQFKVLNLGSKLSLPVLNVIIFLFLLLSTLQSLEHIIISDDENFLNEPSLKFGVIVRLLSSSSWRLSSRRNYSDASFFKFS